VALGDAPGCMLGAPEENGQHGSAANGAGSPLTVRRRARDVEQSGKPSEETEIA
jgi:hypothetical protein